MTTTPDLAKIRATPAAAVAGEPAGPTIVSIPASDLDVFFSVTGPVVDRLERDWHHGKCGCPDVDLTGICEVYGAAWRDYTPATFTPETVLFALRDVSASGQIAAAA